MVVAFMAACNLSGGEVVVSTVQPALRIDLANPLELDSRFALRLTTLEETCETSRLLADGIVGSDQIEVEVSGLMVPSTCTVGKASIRKDLEMSLEEQSYTFNMAISDDLHSYGSLSYNGKAYVLDLENVEGFTVGHTELHEIPESIVWGTLSSSTNPYDAYQDLLILLGPLSAPLELDTGYYGHFTIEQGGSVSLSEDVAESNAYTYPYIIRLKSDTEVLKGILNSFRSLHSDMADLTCTTWDGRSL